MMASSRWMTGSKTVDDFLDKFGNRRSVPLKHRSGAFWLLALYIPLITLPWVLTCILAQRPINATSYINHKGFSDPDIRNFRNWKNAVDVLNSIAGLITIPFLSALLAQAAVVFCQRTHPGQFLGLQDLFALADRGWTNIAALWRCVRSRPGQAASGTKWAGSFLLPAACLILLGALQQPLHQILVNMETTVVTTCRDTQYQYKSSNATHCVGHKGSDYRPIGIDIEPTQMAHIYHPKFLPRLISDLASISLNEEQPNLWSDYMSRSSWLRSRSMGSDMLDESYKSLRPWIPRFASETNDLPKFFVAGLAANSSTGVLREHIMRLNSSVQCKEIDRNSFPSPCPGMSPFATTLRKVNDTTIRVCVPGETGTFPWTRSRNRQDLTEELYLDLVDADRFFGTIGERLTNMSTTIRCEAKTTRGYFELGNTWNNNTYGELLDRWPSREHMLDNSNNWVDQGFGKSGGFIPSEMDEYEGGGPPPKPTSTRVPSDEWRVSGPLAISAIALFSNTSWIHNVIEYATNTSYADARDEDQNWGAKSPLKWQRLCAGMPFGGLVSSEESRYAPAYRCQLIDHDLAAGYTPRSMDLLSLTHEWIAGFAPDTYRKMEMAEALLQISMFSANRALLTFYSPSVDYTAIWRGRTIHSSPGQMVQRPVVSKAAMVVLSVLLALQSLSLIYLAYYIYHVPTWTGSLDAIAIARIGASLRDQYVLPPIGPVDEKDLDALRNVDGLIGVVEKTDDNGRSQRRRASSNWSDDGASVLNLELQQVGSKGPYINVEAQGSDIQLGLGVSGVIHSGMNKEGRKRHRQDDDAIEEA